MPATTSSAGVPAGPGGTKREGTDFIRSMVAADVEAGKHGGRVVTRFPPEPNGFLHIGHAKSICLNFGLAREFGGTCHLRFDDTNPETEDKRYVDSIIDTVRWLGFDWGDHLYYASDYFEELYDIAVRLIRDGHAYVDSQSDEEIRENRGTVTEPGRPSPFRDRPPEENLDLFRRMRAGDFPDGAHVLRAKIDMASPNMLMRDPLLYRIRHARHYRTGDRWCIYPLYDYAHALEDAIECVTHSLCTLEFEINREIYDWVIERAPVPCRPRQTEFARGDLDYTITSKRKLLQLVDEGLVSGWDDPRMPTLAGLRRRGVRPEAIRAFWTRMGIAKTQSRADAGKFEFALRDDLNSVAPRVMAVLRPLKIVITNFPEGQVEELEAPYFPDDIGKPGSRSIPFSRELLIEREDFQENPSRGFRRLAPGREVRLRYAFFIRCEKLVRDAEGELIELHCSYDPETRGGNAPDGRGVQGTIHWVSAAHALPAEVRLYDRLFTVPDPAGMPDEFTEYLNPGSLVVLPEARVEPSVANDPPDTRYQFERQGYFWRDPEDSDGGRLVFNRIVALKDTWAKRAADAQSAGPTAKAAAAKAAVEPKSEGKAGAPEPPRPEWKPATPEIAAAFRQRTGQGLGADEARILAEDPGLAAFFDGALSAGAGPELAANWIINELPRVLEGRAPGELPFAGDALGALLKLVAADEISASAAREVLSEMAESGAAPAAIVAQRGLSQLSDAEALGQIINRIVGANPDKVAAYQAGKLGLIGFFMGQVMQLTEGRANPEMAREMIESRLS